MSVRALDDVMILAYLLTLCVALCAQRVSCRMYWKSWHIADAAAFFLATEVFALLSLLSQRPLLAALLTSLVFFIVACVNIAKKKALRDEPLLFTDATLLSQVFRYPSLYLPFLPWKALLAFSLFLLPPAFFLAQEKLPSELFFPFFLLSAPLPVLFFCAKTGCIRRFLRYLSGRGFVSFSVRQDEAHIGPLAMALLYTLWYRAFDGIEGIRGPENEPFAATLWKPGIRQKLFEKKGVLPHIILIQEESFCDPRPYLASDTAQSACVAELLRNYDSMRREGGSTELAVRAYGAYTMRTEYEVLSGFEPEILSCDRFHPYVRLSRVSSWSLARDLARAGYRTLCIHPYARGFFYRDLALPHLGFQHFVSLEDFDSPTCFGPFVSDMCVAERILSELGDSPTFCFVITMENHGPWTRERLADRPEVRPFQTFASRSESIPPYLAHIRNADAFLGRLRTALRETDRGAVIAMYGDHLPGIPALIPGNATHTPCLFWSTDGRAFHLPDVLAPAHIGGVLLEAVVEREWRCVR